MTYYNYMIYYIVVFLLGCVAQSENSTSEKKLEVRRVYKSECIRQCARSSWDGKIRNDDLPNCQELYKDGECCVYYNPNNGTYGIQTGCEIKEKK